MVKRLTATRIDSARSRAQTSRETLDYASGLAPGLSLRTNRNGTQVWTLRVRYRETFHRFKLGIFPAVDAEAARSLALALINEAKMGRDPRLVLNPPRSGATVREAWGLYAATRTELRSHAMECRRMELHVFPAIGDQCIADAMRAEILVPMLEGLAHRPAKRCAGMRGGKPKGVRGGLTSEANRVYSSVRAFAKWARQRRLIDENPFDADGIQRPVKMEPSEARQRDELVRVLNLDELVALWHGLETEPSLTVRNLVRLLILVPLRRTELGCLAWSEYEPEGEAEGFKGPLLRIPASRMKGKRPAVVPLPGAAKTLLDGRRDEAGVSAFIFPGRSSGNPFSGWRNAGPRIVNALQREKNDAAPFVIHDIRRSVATALVQEVGADELLVGRILQHSAKSALGVTAIYQRSRRIAEQSAVLQAWSELLESKLPRSLKVKEAVE